MPRLTTDLSALFSEPGAVLLDTVRSGGAYRQSLLFTHPLRVLTARTPAAVRSLIDALEGVAAEGRYAAGYLAYEAGYAFEDIARLDAGGEPLAWFGVYDAPIVLTEDAVASLLREAEQEPFFLENVRFAIDRATYAEKIAAVKASIQEGEVYQINFTDKIVFDVGGAPGALYGALRRRQRVAYGAYLHTGEARVLSFSPELFFQREGRRIWTRPMKGTVRRGRTGGEDRALQRGLAADAKSRAENLMIVDLLRNDLARCCVPGSVMVRDLFTTEIYETLIQMTSTIEGHLREGVRYADLFRALFPCGSVTGAPKIRAMQHIHGLEAGPRGIYCGAIGYVAPNDRAVFNVAIRTLVLRDGQGVMGTGGGIVWDSKAPAEYDECLLKAHFLTHAAPHALAGEEDFKLIETMKADGEVIRLLDLHVDRIRASAQYFGFRFDEGRFREHVRAAGRRCSSERCKIRVTLTRQGRLSVTATVLPAAPIRYRRVVFSEQPVDSDDVFFYHKTTRRQRYEDAYRQIRDAGFDEVLFLNERGEVTEGARTNIFVRDGEVLYTPPITSGLLDGVYRRYLLQTRSDTAERVLFPEDIACADAVYLCNAVAGLQEVDEVLFPESSVARHA